jgi:uncharacterized phiE125 gp8 family phage protein
MKQISVIETVAPSELPVTLDKAKQYLRITHDNENELIRSFIEAAKDRWQKATNRTLCSRTLRETLEEFPADSIIELAYPPIVSIVSIKYTTGDVETTMDGSNYTLNTDKGIVIIDVIPSIDDDTYIEITYVAGSDAADIPEDYKISVLAEMQGMYENREQFVPENLELNTAIQRGLFGQKRIKFA